MQQLPRARLLITSDRTPRGRRQAGAPRPFERSLYRPVANPEFVRDPPDPPTEVPHQIDRLAHTRVMGRRRAMGPATLRLQAGEVGGVVPPPPPGQHRPSNPVLLA